jgi:hypothetical protein
MKYLDSVIINLVIHDFQFVQRTVKADSGVFLAQRKNTRIQHSGLNGVANILLANVMPERAIGKLNDDIVHTIFETLSHKTKQKNKRAANTNKMPAGLTFINTTRP